MIWRGEVGGWIDGEQKEKEREEGTETYAQVYQPLFL